MKISYRAVRPLWPKYEEESSKVEESFNFFLFFNRFFPACTQKIEGEKWRSVSLWIIKYEQC